MSYTDSHIRVLINNQIKSLKSGSIKRAVSIGNQIRNKDKQHGTLLTGQKMVMLFKNDEQIPTRVEFNSEMEKLFVLQNKKSAWK